MTYSIKQLHQAYSDQTQTVSSVTKFYLEQIESLNPSLNAVIAVNPDALDVAADQDIMLAEGKNRGSLFGIPVLVKDNIETRELPTTAGSLALSKNVTNRDADLVMRLRHAGAIILGKTNLSEWANFRSERSSSGWSAVGGQTRNPHDLARSPCGSSSGSAVSIAANLSVVAIGTETDGSVICPASLTGIVGLKPSIGLISQTGIVPIAHTQDTAGPMTRTVTDAAILLNVMTTESKTDFAAELTDDSLKNKRIGVLRSATGFHERVDEIFETAINTLRSSGAIIVEDIIIKKPRGFRRDSYNVLLYEFKHNINQYLSGLPNELAEADLQTLIDFNQMNKEVEMPYFMQETFIKAQGKGQLTDEAYTEALMRIRKATRQDGLDKILETNRLDALIAPSGGPAFTIDLINGDHFGGGGETSYPAISGYPHLTLPMGEISGLPVGLSFIGGNNSDHALLKMGYAFEQKHQQDQLQ